jgi:hypothetical protein
MENLPKEIIILEILKNLSYEDLSILCQTNDIYHEICQLDSTWKYLLERDFYVKARPDQNPKMLYLDFRHALNIFSKNFRIVTQTALKAFVDYFPILEWNDLSDVLDTFQFTIIVTLDTLLVTNEGMLNQTVKDNFRNKTANSVIYPNFEQMVQENNETQCTKFEQIVAKPSIIFVDKIPVLINYDIDLAQSILFFMRYEDFDVYCICEDKLNQMNEEIILLLR